MGRKKVKSELKKQRTSVTVTEEINHDFGKLKIKNKSKLVNELLREFFFETSTDKKEMEANNG